MKNLDFLKEILMSTDEYWVVAKKNECNDMGRMVRQSDCIILICVPYTIRRGLTYDEITLKDLEQLSQTEFPNIFLNNNYPPFQVGQRFYDVYKGYPVKTDIRQFMLDAIALESNELWDYKELIKSEPELTTE